MEAQPLHGFQDTKRLRLTADHIPETSVPLVDKILTPLCEATAALLVSSTSIEPAKLKHTPLLENPTTISQALASTVTYPPLAAVTRSQVTALAPLGEQLEVG